MKKLFFALSMLVFIAGCQETDLCKDVVCLNDGVCVSGDCNCEDGYEGTTCQTETRTKFLKTGVSSTETCAGTTYAPYNVDIVTGSDVTKIRIKNLGNYNCSTGDYYIVLTVGSGNNLTIDAQTVCATVWNGTATYNATNNTLSVSYSATYGTPSTTDACTALIQL